ncbi:MAG: hypothetical protein ACHQET_04725 [Chitinophagales bacterium]
MKKGRKRNYSFIVACLGSILCLHAGAQQAERNRLDFLLPSKLEFSVSSIQNQGLVAFNRSIPKADELFIGPISISSPSQIFPSDYYVQHQGFFCKQEWSLEKKSHIPLRFRLGSLEYCNWLEGKK